MNNADMVHEARYDDRSSPTSHSQKLASLSRIERHFLSALVDGRSVESIANELGMSDLLAECYRAQVMRKLDVHSIIDLLIVADLAAPVLDRAA